MSEEITWFDERLHPHIRQSFKIGEILFRQKTDFQDLMVFEVPGLGRVLSLDGVVQTTEADEAIYHEMLAHVPILAHGSAKSVCIIGGGDGGMLEEVLKHKSVEHAVMVELDPAVVELSKKYLPDISRGCFDDPRAELVFADAAAYMAEHGTCFDVIISDSTDPIGPGEVLFRADHYGNCKKRLTPGGVLVTQNGVPFLQPDEVTTSAKRLARHFSDVTFYLAAVPTYYGGPMAFGWASDDDSLKSVSEKILAERFAAAGIGTDYYTPPVHRGAFALPPRIGRLFGQESGTGSESPRSPTSYS